MQIKSKVGRPINENASDSVIRSRRYQRKMRAQALLLKNLPKGITFRISLKEKRLKSALCLGFEREVWDFLKKESKKNKIKMTPLIEKMVLFCVQNMRKNENPK